ncbi:MAG TPA: tyrosine-protein phosphatase [Candidatus Dormibacteraeota bacterium]|jgi:protein tyrosine/serine phosphatase|nr:tyrosine-protein phosphatase [Candidatus Dormibacteraeota bacterium]
MMTMIDVRQLPLHGADNVRDLGGLPTRDGRRTREGRLIRSASVHELTDLDIEWLVDRIGVRTIVDLRLPEEAERQALGSLAQRVGAYANLPVRTAGMVSAEVIADAVEIDLLIQYIGFLEASGPEIVAAVRLLADPSNQPALFHCAAGKDRTGVMAALLLDAVGVEEEAIVADYALSEAHMGRVIARLSRVSWYREALSRLPASVHLAEPETMRRFLGHLHTEHGGAGRWLTDRGLEPATLDALRRSLVGAVHEDDAHDLPDAVEGSR